VYLFDTMPEGMAQIAGDCLPAHYVDKLRLYRRAPGVVKVDWALSEPVPWAADACRRAGSLHVCGTYQEVAESMHAVMNGRLAERPFLTVAQPSLFDATRTPGDGHVLWAWAAVPNGWLGDYVDAMEQQLERFAPGFRDVVVQRAYQDTKGLEARNPNLVGGDIAGGAFSPIQALFRPVVAAVPYATPNPALYLCSAATPPGAGVHGMCGFHAARTVLRRRFRERAA
jgi:phytoene dehydrogenase-like protein